ncbi:hypothetical protein ACIRRA_40010 [Nocardia sp. NPDC101769]|uniref:hypothetical protein n=1 Tax=Nocardia sp. NPDC101769 TaxID=3364333 RepID=UPI0037F43A2A
MSRRTAKILGRPSRATTITALCVLAAVLVAGASNADGAPEATLQDRYSTVTAHVTGETSGDRCQIAGEHVAGPWSIVKSDGTVDLTLDRRGTGPEGLRILCESPERGDVSIHTIRSHLVPHGGPLSPIRQIIGSKLFQH